MNEAEARELLVRELAGWRTKPYEELRAQIGGCFHAEVAGASGTAYQLQIEAFWDGQAGAPIRVLGSVDDGGWRAFSPVCEDLIKSPDGTFVGEAV